MICLHPVAMDEAEVKEMKDSLQQKVTATEVKVAIATAKKEIQDQFFRLTRALEGKVDQSFGDALSGAARERKREREREREREIESGREKEDACVRHALQCSFDNI